MKTFLFTLLNFFSFFAGAQLRVYVSPRGNDSNIGSPASPVASLNGARDVIREFKKRQKISDTIKVIIEDGFYEMSETFLLNAGDGGSMEFPVIYKAAENSKPVFSGGKKITGITVDSLGAWKVKIPESVRYNWKFHQLYVNGKRAQLARTPNNGFLQINAVNENTWLKGNGRIAEKALQILSFDSINYKPFQTITQGELNEALIRVYHKWDFTLRHIDKLKNDSLRLYTSGAGMQPWNAMGKGDRLVLENYAAALDEPGEWFLDMEGILSYLPLPGETPGNSEVIIPVLEKLIDIKGNVQKDELVENIKFEGLTFSHSLYHITPQGFEPYQASIFAGAAIVLEGAKNIVFSNCEISKTGQHAIWFGKGCSYSSIENCYIQDIGGGGIYLGDIQALVGAEHTSHIRIYNNIIQTGGREFPSAVGIWTGHSSDLEILHNDISDFFYTGISVGWVWGYTPSLAKRNIIKYNHIHHIGWSLLSDMAAVYTLGASEGTVISNNVIHHIHAYSYGGWGLYTDEGSLGIQMENNLVYNTKTGGFHQHYGKDNFIRNNIFAFAKQYQLQATRVEDHQSFTFTNNIIVFDTGVVLQGPWNKMNIKMDQNIYWSPGGKNYLFAGKDFNEWKQNGNDRNSFIIDPLFKNVYKYDFKFSKNNSINKINFKPFNIAEAGVTGEKEWKQKAELPQSIITAFDQAVELNMHKQ